MGDTKISKESPKTKVVVEKGTYCTEKVIVLIYSIRVLVDWQSELERFRLSGEIQES